MITAVRVGVALTRPPAVHEYRKIIVHTDTNHLTEACLIAAQVAACTAIMPVELTVLDVLEI